MSLKSKTLDERHSIEDRRPSVQVKSRQLRGFQRIRYEERKASEMTME